MRSDGVKAITRGRTRKEVVEDEGVRQIFREQTRSLMEKSVRTGMCTMLGVVLCILYKRGWHKDRLNMLVDDVISILRLPSMPQGSLDNAEVVTYMQGKGIDPLRVYNEIRFSLE